MEPCFSHSTIWHRRSPRVGCGPSTVARAGFAILMAFSSSVAGRAKLAFNKDIASMHVRDFHTTMLHLLVIDHERVTYRFQGRDFHLTDVSGRVVKEILVTNGKVAT